MKQEISLNSDELSTTPLDALVEELVGTRKIRLFLDKPVRIDAVRSSVLLAVAARCKAVVEIEFPYGTASRESAESLDRCLLGPLLWRAGPRRNLTIAPNSIGQPLLYIADPEHRAFYAHTSRLSSRTREDFRAALAIGLRKSGIVLPLSVFEVLSAVGFELNSNAEEYGAVDEEGVETPSSRMFCVAVTSQLLSEEATLAHGYLHEYASTHTMGNSWLQLIVADSGVGMAYPSYFVRSESDSRGVRSIYEVDVREEQTQLRLVLEDYTSTKRSFGRRLNLQTAVGEGTKIVRFKIAGVRGFAGVRTGRCAATWWHASRTLNAEEFFRLGRFEVQSDSAAIIKGTVWQVLIPLDTQFGLL